MIAKASSAVRRRPRKAAVTRAGKSRAFHPSAIFLALRARLGLTQAEMARVLGISRKAIESYEQGWRNVPRSVFNELIAIRCAQSGHDGCARPCWQIVKCSSADRAQCLAFHLTQGRLCWLVAQNNCRKHRLARRDDLAACLSCAVVSRFL
jgi:DNA-binding XRE family transcriptional regulator